jgi:excisionase family DNA binding protein
MTTRLEAAWVTREGAAKHLGVSIHAIRKWNRNGRLQYRKFGRSVRISWVMIRQFEAGG